MVFSCTIHSMASSSTNLSLSNSNVNPQRKQSVPSVAFELVTETNNVESFQVFPPKFDIKAPKYSETTSKFFPPKPMATFTCLWDQDVKMSRKKVCHAKLNNSYGLQIALETIQERPSLACGSACHRIIETFRLEEAFKIIESSCKPRTAFALLFIH